ncbi:MAG: hypothetical protein M1826_000647 [Phylliscum demangeonii]|nr:MAG: hypothetical protein M1826_000647 [Phylliscum demangeonii]
MPPAPPPPPPPPPAPAPAPITAHPTELLPFAHAVAGHGGLLSDAGGAVIIKPCTAAEIGFYESAHARHRAFAAWMPTLIGTLKLSPSTTDPGPGESSSSKRITTDLAIVLENVAAGFVRPNVLDVKLGARLWSESASAAKRARLDRVMLETTSGSRGFRITGMKVWQGDDGGGGAGGYRVFGKDYGRALTAADVEDGFRTYLGLGMGMETETETAELGRRVARRLAADVRALLAMLRREESRVVGGSLLVVYEGDEGCLREALRREEAEEPDERERERERTRTREEARERVGGAGPADSPPRHDAHGEGVEDEVEDEAEDDGDDDGDDDDDAATPPPPPPRVHRVALIDFAHAHWTPGQGADANVLRGMQNVHDILDRLGRGHDDE